MNRRISALFIAVVFSGAAFARLTSPFPSTIRGVKLNNAHIISETESGALVVRAMQPHEPKHFRQLVRLGVTEIVIAMTNPIEELEPEIASFEAAGISREMIHVVPFPYFGYEDFSDPCKQTLEILNYIRLAREEHRSIFIHCTVGEDRTGSLAGIIKLLDGAPEVGQVFKNQMCLNGYSAGNPKKPKNVVGNIDKDLTEHFLRMSWLIENGKLSWKKLDPQTCNLWKKQEWRPTEKRFKKANYRCQQSERFDPNLTSASNPS